MKTVVITLSTLFSFTSFGQDHNSIENLLLVQFKKINHWAKYEGDNEKIDKYDSLENANRNFRELLIKCASENSSTLTFNFRHLEKEGLTISTSADSMFRIYSWDTYTGGTMHFFENVYQYKTNAKVFAKSFKESENKYDPEYWYSTIYSLTATGKTYYLGLRHGIYSNKDMYQGVKVFTIKNNALNTNAKLINTKSGLKNTLGFEFDFFSVAGHQERPVQLIRYKADTKTLVVPVVLKDGNVTNKNVLYQFTGQFFELKK